MASGMRKAASNSVSHWWVWMLNSNVREALLTSVACTAQPLSSHISQLSTVPNSSSPRSACSRALGTLSKIHCSLVPEKYASISKPVLAWMVSASPCSRRAAQAGSVRRSCHTMAL
jgi:hypothetical protein